MRGQHSAEEGTYIIDGTVPDAHVVLASAEPILESYRDLYDDLLPIQSSTRVLDIGCGLGHFLLYARSRGAGQLLGLDLGVRQVDLCRSLGFEAETIGSIPSALAERRNSYDLVHMSHVIEHVNPGELTEALSAIRCALAPGGLFALRTPNMSHWLSGHMRYLDLTHVAGFTAWSLRQALWTAGFRAVDVYPSHHRLHWRPKRVAWFIAQKALRALFRLSAYIEMGSDRPTIQTPEIIALARLA